MKIIKSLLALSLLLIMCGCHQNASDELTKKLVEENVPVTLAWVKENIDGATDITADIEYGGAYRVFADMCNGSYTRNDRKCEFYFNTETKEFATDEFYDLVTDTKKNKLIEDLPVGFVYEDIDIAFGDEIMTVHYVMDQNFTGKTNDVKYEAYNYELFKMSHLYRLEELEQFVNDSLYNDYVSVIFTVSDFDAVKEYFGDLEYTLSKSNWNMEFAKSDSEEKYSCVYDGESCFFMHEYQNDKGEMVSEVLNQR